jgi:hypothetical protein
MTRHQARQLVDDLAENVATFVFEALDAEIWIHGDEAGRVASAIERAFRHEMDALFDLRQSNHGRPERSHNR